MRAKWLGVVLGLSLGGAAMVAPSTVRADEVDSLTEALVEMAALIKKEKDCTKMADSLLAYVDNESGKLERLGKKVRDRKNEMSDKQRTAFKEAERALDQAVGSCKEADEVLKYAKVIFREGRNDAMRPMSSKEKAVAEEAAKKALEEAAAKKAAEAEAAAKKAEAEAAAKKAAEAAAAEAAAKEAAAKEAAAKEAVPAEQNAAAELTIDTTGLPASCVTYAAAVIDACKAAPAVAAQACEAWIQGIESWKATPDAADAACTAGLEGVKQTAAAWAAAAPATP